jgi:hypothetical protein
VDDGAVKLHFGSFAARDIDECACRIGGPRPTAAIGWHAPLLVAWGVFVNQDIGAEPQAMNEAKAEDNKIEI